MDIKTPRFRIQWPEGAQLKMEKEHLLQIRKSLEVQFSITYIAKKVLKTFIRKGNLVSSSTSRLQKI